MRQLMGDGDRQDAIRHLLQLQQRINADKRFCAIERQPDQPQSPLPRLAIRNAYRVDARNIRKILLPDRIKVACQLLPGYCQWLEWCSIKIGCREHSWTPQGIFYACESSITKGLKRIC